MPPQALVRSLGADGASQLTLHVPVLHVSLAGLYRLEHLLVVEVALVFLPAPLSVGLGTLKIFLH